MASEINWGFCEWTVKGGRVNSGYFVSVLWKMSDWHKAGDIIWFNSGWLALAREHEFFISWPREGSERINVKSRGWAEQVPGIFVGTGYLAFFFWTGTDVHGIHVQVEKLLTGKAGKNYFSEVMSASHFHFLNEMHRRKISAVGKICWFVLILNVWVHKKILYRSGKIGGVHFSCQKIGVKSA